MYTYDVENNITMLNDTPFLADRSTMAAQLIVWAFDDLFLSRLPYNSSYIFLFYCIF